MRRICFKFDKRARHVKAYICEKCANTILFCLPCLKKMEVFSHKYYQQRYGNGGIVCRDCASIIVVMDDVMDERFDGNYLDIEERSATRAVLFG